MEGLLQLKDLPENLMARAIAKAYPSGRNKLLGQLYETCIKELSECKGTFPINVSLRYCDINSLYYDDRVVQAVIEKLQQAGYVVKLCVNRSSLTIDNPFYDIIYYKNS